MCTSITWETGELREPKSLWSLEITVNCSTDPTSRPSHLIHHFYGEAFEAIDHFTILGVSEGYIQAWCVIRRRLRKYGAITHQNLSKITHSPAIRQDDNRELTKLTETMNACELTFLHPNFKSSLIFGAP